MESENQKHINHWLDALVKGKWTSTKPTRLATGVVCHPDSGGTIIFLFFLFFVVGGIQGVKCVSEGKNPQICQKWLILTFFSFWLGESGVHFRLRSDFKSYADYGDCWYVFSNNKLTFKMKLCSDCEIIPLWLSRMEPHSRHLVEESVGDGPGLWWLSFASSYLMWCSYLLTVQWSMIQIQNQVNNEEKAEARELSIVKSNSTIIIIMDR